MAYSLYLIRNTRDTDLYYAEHGEIGGVPDAVGYQNGWPKITSGPGATRVIWCSLHLTRTAPWQK